MLQKKFTFTSFYFITAGQFSCTHLYVSFTRCLHTEPPFKNKCDEETRNLSTPAAQKILVRLKLKIKILDF